MLNECDYKNYAKRSRCKRCENVKNSQCKVVYNTPVFMKKQNTASHMVSRSITETRNKMSAQETVMIKGEALKWMQSQEVMDFFGQYVTLKEVTLNKNVQTGQSNDFGIIECYSPEDAEYLIRVITAADFRLGGYPLTGSLSKLNKQTFLAQYSNIQQSEQQQAQAYQQQQAYKSYYENFFAYLAKAGYYYDAEAKEYKPLSDNTSFEQIQIQPPHREVEQEAAPQIEVDITKETAINNERLESEEETSKMVEEKPISQIPHPDQVELEKPNQITIPTLQTPQLETPKPVEIVYCTDCRRKFNGHPFLQYHIKFSSLHKKTTSYKWDLTNPY